MGSAEKVMQTDMWLSSSEQIWTESTKLFGAMALQTTIHTLDRTTDFLPHRSSVERSGQQVKLDITEHDELLIQDQGAQ